MFFVGYFEGIETEPILSSTVMHGTQSDHYTLIDSVGEAQLNLERADVEATISQVAAGKGYHTNQQITDLYRPRTQNLYPGTEPEESTPLD